MRSDCRRPRGTLPGLEAVDEDLPLNLRTGTCLTRDTPGAWTLRVNTLGSDDWKPSTAFHFGRTLNLRPPADLTALYYRR